MGRPKKIRYPDKLIRVDMTIHDKQVTIQYLGPVSTLRIVPQLANGQLYNKHHSHAVIINHEYMLFF